MQRRFLINNHEVREKQLHKILPRNMKLKKLDKILHKLEKGKTVKLKLKIKEIINHEDSLGETQAYEQYGV